MHLPSIFKGRLLVVASAGDEGCGQLIKNYRAANATVIEPEAIATAGYRDQFEGVSCYATKGTLPLDLVFLTSCFTALKPGGNCTVQCVVDDADGFIEGVSKNAMYAGFIDGDVSRRDSADNKQFIVQFVCKKPDWDLGAATAVKIDSPGEEELIDESSLIDDKEEYKPLGAGKESCASKPKACANCTCGRAELEKKIGAEEAKKKLETGGVRSSCGNCYLGDAFRCAGCPYKGQPAFKPGEKIELDMDASNTGQVDLAQGSESVGVSEGGTVKLEL
ncbi:unnamed protein product [Vitrella brassicaformis CCMP3155]|uniref:Anamorsin homolog n=1 Tax=Vitrella brassicaformis (strain CCMP3155) TaxID=1169540 RepID=A0A0G4GIW3_VITBC|nr:unnamed protein product [Vitrella brassicaformis CCMP3155]|eukprot:CEM29693.1 unnamed protein product [Vitrella brassicaformis CCMP3155]